jgi:hypothetical protein
MVFTLSATERAGGSPVFAACCNCSITPMNARGNHIESYVGVTHSPPVVFVDA